MSDNPSVPQCWTSEIAEFLDQLKESAVTNMLGSGRYLEREFGLTRFQAKDCAKYYCFHYKRGDQ